jgi:hypothetical protein
MFGLFGGSQRDIYGDQAGLSGGFGGGGSGLGGMSNTLMMAGLGLMSSPRTNPWENVMKGVVAGSALDERSGDKREQAQAVYQALRASGVPHEQAILAAKSPAAAQILLDVRKQQISKEATTDAFSRAEKFLGMPGDDSGAPRVSPAAPQPPVPSMKGGGRRSDAPAEFAPLFAEKEKEYNLPEGYLARTASLESSFNPNAKNPKSSASGLFQFINSTARQYGLADPFDPVASTDAAARLAATNAAGLKRALGRDPTAGELYLAHQQGLGGATKILSNPNASVASLVGGEAARLNAGGGKTGGQFAQQWLNKFGASPARSTQVASNDSSFMPGPSSEEDVGLESQAETVVAQAPVLPRSADAPNGGSFTPSGPQGPLSGASGVSGMTFGAPQQAAPEFVPGQGPQDTSGVSYTEQVQRGTPAIQPPAPATSPVSAPPLPPERPPETYTPRAPLRPVASQPPIASIDPNSSNAGAIQFAASGMGRGGMPAAPQPSRMAAAPPALAAQPAGVQVAQAPTQTATDATPAAQAQAQVAAQQGQRIIESTPQKAPEQYPAGSSSQRVSAQDFYRRGVGLGMIAATPNLPENVSKFFAEKSKWYLERAGKFIDPTDAEKVVDRLGLPREQANELLRQTLPNQGLTELQKNARAASGDPLKQQELIERGMPDKTPEVLRLDQGIKDDAHRKRVIDLKRAGAQNIDLGGGSNKQVFETMEKSHSSAAAAASGLNGIREAKKALNAGGIFGFGADQRLAFAKLGSIIFGPDAAVENTETFRSAMAPQVAAMLKATVGSVQVSNADREFAEKAAAGSITLDEKSIKRLVGVMERMGNEAVRIHKKKMDAVYPDKPEFARERALFAVDVEEGAAPAAPAAPEQSGDGGWKEISPGVRIREKK